MNISQKIHKLRIENGYSQEELAEKLNVPSRYIAYWEDGVTPELSVIVKLSNIFNVSTDYLLKDDVDGGGSEKAKEEVVETEEIQVEQTDEEIIKAYIDKRQSRGDNIASAVLFGLWALIPLANFDFNPFVILDFTEGILSRIIGIAVFIFFGNSALAFLNEVQNSDDIESNDLIIDEFKVQIIKRMYNDFKSKTVYGVFVLTLISILTLILAVMIAILFPYFERDFIDFIFLDGTLIVFSLTLAVVMYIKFEEKVYETLLKQIERGEFKEAQQLEEINELQELEKIHKIEGNNTKLDVLKVETYINSKKKQASLINNAIIYLSMSIIPIVFYYYGLIESIHNEELRDYTNIVMISAITLLALLSIICFKVASNLDTTLELNKTGGLVFNRTEKAKFDEMYITFNKDRSSLLVREIVVFIAIAVIGNITIGVFNMGNLMRFIVLSVIIIFIGCIIGTFISTRCQNNGYKTVMNYVGEVRINKHIKAGSNKKGIKILDSTGVDEYLNNRIKSEKNSGIGVIFLALGIVPLINYCYRDEKIFNSMDTNDSPEILLITIMICSILSIFFLAKSSYFNYKFKSNYNYDFILNEFAENKLKFMYEKFKSRRIGKIIFSIVIYASAIISTTYLVLMFKDNHYAFNGTPYMFYGLFGVTTFLYAFATYFIITIKYEQGAYKTLLKNVLD